MTQSYRNKQVRHIAQVLSSIDPGTTVASKMKLAFQFEDQMFKASSSLEDYHKKMNKRLAKLQKKFNPNAPAAAVGDGAAQGSSAAAGGSAAAVVDEKQTPKFQELHSKLVKQYGPSLLYIYEKAPAAIDTIATSELQQQQQQKSSSPGPTSSPSSSSTSPSTKQSPSSSSSSSLPEKAAQLKKHTDDAQRWGLQLGIFTSMPDNAAGSAPEGTKPQQRELQTKVHINNINDPSSLDPTIRTYNELLQIEQYLQKRIENVKSYVMKYGDVDTWTLHNLLEKDEQYRSLLAAALPSSSSSSTTLSSFQEKAAYHLARRLDSIASRQQQHKGAADGSSGTGTGTAATDQNVGSSSIQHGQQQQLQQQPQQLQEKAKKKFLEAYNGTILQRIPPPTRDNKRETEIGLAYIAKMRAAANALEDYFKIPNRHTDGVLLPRIASVPAPAGSSGGSSAVLEKIHSTTMEGMEYCLKVLKERANEQQKHRESQKITEKSNDATGNDGDNDDDNGKRKRSPEDFVELQDAWMKSLLKDHQDGVDSTAEVVEISDDEDPSSPAKKKHKADSTVLRQTNGKDSTKPAYIQAKMLLQNPNKPATNQLLTALARKRVRLYQRVTTTVAVAGGNKSFLRDDIMATHLVLDFGTAFQMTIWLSPLLVEIRAMPESSADSENMKTDNLVPPSSSASSSARKPLSYGLADSSPNRSLTVWGVKGNYATLGRVVEERLRNASTQATYVLRKSFAKHVKDKILPLEVEILETSALMDFLNQARTTYIPDWQDVY